MRKIIATALLAATPLLAIADSANLVNNGSFEATAINNGNWTIVSSLAGWTTGDLGIELRNNVVGSALAGNNFAELDTTGNSSISQSIATVAGQWYTLSFAYSNRSDVAVNSNGLSWTFGDTTGNAIASTLASGGNQWQQFSTVVKASGSSMTLSFSAIGSSDSLGSSLDNISVSAVPEPQSYALLLAGLGAMALVVRRRKTRD